MNENYNILIKKLDEFIRKYYRNQLLKGVLLFLALFLFSFLVVNILEYLGHFGTFIRTMLFYFFLVSNFGILTYYILFPVLKLIRIGNIISYEQASEIIGKHFSAIGDKLINTLQLQELMEQNRGRIDLLEASINQKIHVLKPVPFGLAIDFSKNKKFLKYTLPPVFILLAILFVSPSLVLKPTNRIIGHSTVFVEEMPFHIVILNQKMEAFQQDDFILKVKVTGDKIPDDMFIESEGITYKLTKENKIYFNYTFKSLQRSKKFILVTGRYRTREYEVIVYPKPTILNFEVDIRFPEYLNRKEEIFENTGDMTIPEGTMASWRLVTKDVDSVVMKFDGISVRVKKEGNNRFEYSLVCLKNRRYTIHPVNAFVRNTDSLVYNLLVIPDGNPVISMGSAIDTLLPTRIYFKGMIKDDYGFSGLTFNYFLIKRGDSVEKTRKTEPLQIIKGLNQQPFYYTLDLAAISQDPEDEIQYFFEVCDNDGIHGPKCTRTFLFKYKAPTDQEIHNISSQKEQDITKDLESALKDAKALQKQIDAMNKKMTEKSSMSWQDKKQLEELLQKEKNIKESLDNIQKQNEQKNLFEQTYQKPDSIMMEKQKQLNELFKDLMDDEMKKMVDEIRKMLDKIDKNEVSKVLEKMKLSNKDVQKQLDRSIDIFKQIEFEKELSKTIEDLKKLAGEEEKLAEKTENSEQVKDELKKEQEDIRKKYDDVKKNIEELEEKNKKLDEPAQFPSTDQKQEEINKNLEESKNALEKKDKKSAKESQKNAAKGMKSVADQLQAMKEDNDTEEEAEDAALLRQILENLVRISFNQEDLMNKTKTINRNDPKYLNLIQEQNDLKEDLAMVEDSLNQLAKRQIMIKPFILREISSINRNVDETVKNLNDRNVQVASTKQQFVMTSVNNLALMLDESLKKMESQSNSQCKKPGKSTCNNPGGKGKKSIKSLRQLQEQLNKKLQGLKKNMDSKSDKGEGKMGSEGKKKMSEQMARMAAEQEAIRNEMRKYQDQLNEEGKKTSGGLNDAMQKMEETEKDLVNKRVLQETLKRQQDILTRLLESEKAELQREQEEKRESTEAKNQKISNPKGIFEYKGKKEGETDLMKTVQPSYNYFYKTKINDYFLKFEQK